MAAARKPFIRLLDRNEPVKLLMSKDYNVNLPCIFKGNFNFNDGKTSLKIV